MDGNNKDGFSLDEVQIKATPKVVNTPEWLSRLSANKYIIFLGISFGVVLGYLIKRNKNSGK